MQARKCARSPVVATTRHAHNRPATNSTPMSTASAAATTTAAAASNINCINSRRVVLVTEVWPSAIITIHHAATSIQCHTSSTTVLLPSDQTSSRSTTSTPGSLVYTLRNRLMHVDWLTSYGVIHKGRRQNICQNWPPPPCPLLSALAQPLSLPLADVRTWTLNTQHDQLV